jgi:hypothetical protein
MPTHVSVGATADFESYLDHNVGGGPAGKWPVKKNAKPGERVVLMVPALHGPFRAHGIVAATPQQGTWGDSPRYFAPVQDLARIDPPVPVELLSGAFPEWKWTSYPRSFTTVPEDLDAAFWQLIQNPPLAYDTEPPDPGRVSVHTSRIVRDTAAAYGLKVQYSFKCQLCGTALQYGPTAFYAEVHHLRPLGRPHNGPDAQDNMLVLCPNHHALFDLGVPAFVEDDRASINGRIYNITYTHRLAPEHVAYYSARCQRAAAGESRTARSAER